MSDKLRPGDKVRTKSPVKTQDGWHLRAATLMTVISVHDQFADLTGLGIWEGGRIEDDHHVFTNVPLAVLTKEGEV